MVIIQSSLVSSAEDSSEGPLCNNSEVCNISDELISTSLLYEVNWEKIKVESKKDMIPSILFVIPFGFGSGLFISMLVLTLVFMYLGGAEASHEKIPVTEKEVQHWQIEEQKPKPENHIVTDDPEKFMELASQSDNRSDRFRYYKLAAESYEKKGEYDRSATCWELCGKIMLEIDNLSPKAGEYFKNAGCNYDNSGSYAPSLECFNKSANIYKKIGTNRDLYQLYYCIAYRYESKRQDSVIIRYNYLEIAKHAPAGYKEILQGFAYRLNEDAGDAKNQLESVLNYFNAGLQELRKFPENEKYIQLFIGLIKNKDKNYGGQEK